MYLEVDGGWGSFEGCFAWGGQMTYPRKELVFGEWGVEFAWRGLRVVYKQWPELRFFLGGVLFVRDQDGRGSVGGESKLSVGIPMGGWTFPGEGMS